MTFLRFALVVSWNDRHTLDITDQVIIVHIWFAVWIVVVLGSFLCRGWTSFVIVLCKHRFSTGRLEKNSDCCFYSNPLRSEGDETIRCAWSMLLLRDRFWIKWKNRSAEYSILSNRTTNHSEGRMRQAFSVRWLHRKVRIRINKLNPSLCICYLLSSLHPRVQYGWNSSKRDESIIWAFTSNDRSNSLRFNHSNWLEWIQVYWCCNDPHSGDWVWFERSKQASF